MKLHIISDGTPHGTKVIDAETGKEIERVRKVEITIDVFGGVVAHITVEGVHLDLLGHGTIETK